MTRFHFLLFCFLITCSCNTTKNIKSDSITDYQQSMYQFYLENSLLDKLSDTYFSLNITQDNGIKFQILFQDLITREKSQMDVDYSIYISEFDQIDLVSERVEQCEKLTNSKFEILHAFPKGRASSPQSKSGVVYIFSFNGEWNDFIDLSTCLLDTSDGRIYVKVINKT